MTPLLSEFLCTLVTEHFWLLLLLVVTMIVSRYRMLTVMILGTIVIFGRPLYWLIGILTISSAVIDFSAVQAHIAQLDKN